MSKKIIIGNWKMNPITLKDAEKLFKNISKELLGKKKIAIKSEIVVCPPFIYLNSIKKLSRANQRISLGAQNAFIGDVGAFTGEISPEMLSNIGVKYVILGHSERRALGESNSDINKKIKASLSAGLIPIFCVGENARDGDHAYFNVVKEQTEVCLDGISRNLISKIIIAYEPVWALSTTVGRKDATAADSLEMVIFIKKILSDKFGVKTELPRIIYGGSVTDRDAGEFLINGGVDGLLPGRASLDAKKFGEIVRIAENLRN